MAAFTGSVSDLLTGDVPSSTDLGYITDALQALSGAWTTFTPTWTSSGTAPAIGNAVVNGRYIQVGKFVVAVTSTVFGSSSTFGTGTYSFALPVACPSTTNYVGGTALLWDNNTTTRATASVLLSATTTFSMHADGGTAVGAAFPWTWAQDDYIKAMLVYEAS